MKSQTKQLIALAIVLLAALAVYVGLRIWNGGKAESGAAEDPVQNPAQSLVELTDLTRLSFTAENGATLSFTKEGDTWLNADEPELPLAQQMLDEIETQFCTLTFQRALEEHDELSGYGLDPAVRTVTGTDAAGGTCTILLGNEVNYEGVYYAMVEGRDTVYTVSGDLFSAISYDLMDLAEAETLPELNEKNVKSISLTIAEGELALNKLTEKKRELQEQETGETDENGEAVTVLVEIYHWFLSNGAEIPDGNETLTGVLEELSALRFSSVCAFRPTEEELADFGLETTLTVECMDGTRLVLLLGVPDETGASCYARLDGSDLIHLMPVSCVDDLLAMTEEALTAQAG